MIVGIPTEIKADEQRVSLTPAGVAALRLHGHRAMVQAGAGVGSGFADSDYRKAGASIVAGAAAVWRHADVILKVKEPQPPEFPLMRPRQILFTYLHLAADPRVASASSDGRWLRDHPARGFKSAAACADERSRRTPCDSGRLLVPASA